MSATILEAQNLKMHFPIMKGIIFQKTKSIVKAVDGVSLTLKTGETLGLVGESGCGKSTLGRTLLRLYNPTSGKITLDGQDITNQSQHELRPLRTKFQMIFQDPYASLNPRMTVYDIISEPIKTHHQAQTKKELDVRINTMMEQVGLSPRFMKKYPHEFSGGQRQRIAVARALAVNPKVIICDEPVSALDVSIQAQILTLLNTLQKELGLSYIFIAHDISAVRFISHRIAVMYLGKIVEIAETEQLFAHPSHPYTRALLSAVPTADPEHEKTRQRIILKGDLPSPSRPPSGCHFHTRCPQAEQRCSKEVPSAISVEPSHEATCFFAQKVARH